jgi:poly(3-hydroxybutyrate) depolymerase
VVSLSRRKPMIHFVRAGLFFLVALVFAASAEAACDGLFAGGFETPTVMSGSATMQTSDGQAHTYYYRVPRAGAGGCRPVLFWLHGDGGSGNGFGSGFYPYTDAASAILVTPSGINQTWTHAAADLPGQPQDSQFISKIIDSLTTNGIANTQVDPTRIYLGGESRGAYMPYFLLQRQSTKLRLAAVAVNAGLCIAKLTIRIATTANRLPRTIRQALRSCTCMAPTIPKSHRHRRHCSIIPSTGMSTGVSFIR